MNETIELKTDNELHVLLAAAYSKQVQGTGDLRMFDIFMSKVEQIAHVVYNEDGLVIFYQDNQGIREPKTTLKKKPTELAIGPATAWLVKRIKDAPWAPATSRTVIELLKRFGITLENEESKGDQS